MIYYLTVEESTKRVVEIEADSEDQASEIIKTMKPKYFKTVWVEITPLTVTNVSCISPSQDWNKR